ncbi:hypothetical protein [Desulfocastanea catecholica]
MTSSRTNDRIGTALAKQVEPWKELSVQEEKRLEQLENLVVENFKTFVQVGQALAEIKERKLYRMKALTFEKYCKELFDIAKSRVRELINATDVIENLRHGGGFGDDQLLLPLNERQVRPLIKLRPEQQLAVWKAAVESAPRGKVTSSHVANVVKSYLGEKIKKTVHQAQKEVSVSCSAEFSEAFEAFSKQVLKERDANYKHTARGFIIKALDQLRADLADDGDFIDEPAFRGSSSDANKLERAGYSLFRMDRSNMTIKRRDTETGGWVKHSGDYATFKAMEAAFKEILLDDMHLVG